MTEPLLSPIALDGAHHVLLGDLPGPLRLTAAGFEALWAMHPDGFHEIRLFGRLLPVPRWSQTYGVDYPFSGTVQRALPLPEQLAGLLHWSQGAIDPRLNGVLVNWYDGRLGHRIGAHRDDELALVVGAPIVTISFGDSRIWRLRPWPGQERAGRASPASRRHVPDARLRHVPEARLRHVPEARLRHDIAVCDASVLVLPDATNRAFTHEVPALKRHTGRRISVTIRAFQA